MLGNVEGEAHFLDAICLHLTSDRAKERYEAIQQLKDSINNRGRLSSIAWEKVNNAVAAFFKMLSIEFKYVKREGEQAPTLLSKLRQLIRDAKAITSSVVSCGIIIVDTMDPLVDMILDLFKTGTLFELHSEFLGLLNCFFADPVHLRSMDPNNGKKILHVLGRESTTICTDWSVCLLHLATFFFELSSISQLQAVAQLALNQIFRGYEAEHHEFGAILNILKGFSTCMDGLTESHPIFCRTLLRQLITKVCGGPAAFGRRRPLVEELVRIFYVSWPCIRIDNALCIQIADFLCSESTYGKYKLENVNPMVIMEDSESSAAIFLSALSKYAPWRDEDRILLICRPGKRLYSTISIGTLKIFASCLQDSLNLTCASYFLPLISPINQKWCLAGLAQLSDSRQDVCSFALEGLSHPITSDAAAYYLHRHLGRHVLDLTKRIFSGATEITGATIQLLHKNFFVRYGAMMWCKSAQAAFTECLEHASQSLFQSDSKHCINRFSSIVPALFDFLIHTIDESGEASQAYRESVIKWVTDMRSFLSNEVDIEAKRAFVISKLTIDVTSKQAENIVELPLILLLARLDHQASCSLQSVYAALGGIATPQKFVHWILPVVGRLCVSSVHFQSMAFDSLISILIRCTKPRSSATRNPMDTFISEVTKSSDAIATLSDCLLSVLKIVCKINSCDDLGEMEAIKSDLFMFTIDHVEQGPLMSRRELLNFVHTLTEHLPVGCEDRLCEFFNRVIRMKYDITTILLTCQSLHPLKHNPTIGSLLQKALSSLDLDELPFGAKKILLQLKVETFACMPKFLQTESSAGLLALARQIVPGYLPSCDYIPERPEYDEVVGLMFRLSQQAKDMGSLVTFLGRSLQHLPASSECLEIRSYICELLPTPYHQMAARRLLLECGALHPLLDWSLPEGPEFSISTISYFRWEYDPLTISEANYASMFSRVLLDHFRGKKEATGRALAVLKERLGQGQFESLFKSQFLRVLSQIIILSNAFSISLKERDECIAQLCANIKVSNSVVFSGVFLHLLILELLALLDETPLALRPILAALQPLITDELIPPIVRRVKHVLEALYSNTKAEQERKAIMEALSNVKNKTRTAPCFTGKTTTPRSVPLGLADSLYEICSEVETPLASQVIRKISEIINHSSTKLEEVPERLRFALVANYQSSCRSVLKCTLKGSESPAEPQSELLHQLLLLCADPMLVNAGDFLLNSSPSITNVSARWVMAQALLGRNADTIKLIEENFATLIESPVVRQSLAFAFKYTLKQGNLRSVPSLPTITASFTSLEVGEDAKNVLYLAELFGIRAVGLYNKIYSSLQEPSYLHYLQCQSDDIAFIPSMGNVDTLCLNELQRQIDQSVLFTNNWLLEDVPPSFDPNQHSDDRSFLQLRSIWLGESKARREYEDPAVQLLAKLTELGLKKVTASQNFVNEILSTWKSIKKVDLTTVAATRQLRFIKALNWSAPPWNPQLEHVAQYAKAEFLWKHGSPDQALRLINQAILSGNQLEGNPEFIMLLLLRASKWSWLLRCRTAQEINGQFLERLADLSEQAKSNISGDLLAKSHHALARFYDQQYERLRTSDTLHTRRRLIKGTEKAIARLNAVPHQQSELKRTLQQLQNQLAQDRKEVARLTGERVQFALKAATFYSRALQSSCRYDLTASRLCSLFFALRRQPEMLKIMADDNLPVSKFVPLIYQLASRAELVETPSTEAHFQETLQRLLLKALVRHPHHALYPVLALGVSPPAPSASIFESSTPGTKRKLVHPSSPSASSAQVRRSAAATSIITRARASSTALGQLIGDTERLRNALVELASMELAPDTSTKVTHPFEARLLIKKLSSLSCSVPTASLPLDDGVLPITVQSIIDGFRVVGGINLPKIIEMIGSDGNIYRQLVKGRDDLRQDAVMEQIFSLVNRIFQHDPNTKNLRLRTFRVIPLQPLAGILEWVADAIPIGDYLHAAHERFHSTDLTPRQARSLMRQEFEKPDASPAQKIATFRQQLIPRFNPVLGFFFHETTDNVADWYARRRQYTLSTAVASMVGHIVGLGDRHCQNLMLDVRTGELIHIDLNMIFEAGHNLRIPELVPFRLTRDIVHAMGILGLEAAFSAAAAHTIRTLRERTDPMLLIMEVFKYDPLHRWASTVMTGEDNRTSEDGHEEDNLDLDLEDTAGVPKEAERALLRVKEKLQGWEEGTLLSERGQVAHLINVASDLDLLAQMYYGWQSWM